MEPLPIRLNHQTSWEVSIVWPKFAVLDNPDLPDLLVDLSMMHAVQIVLHPSRMEAYYPICPGAAAHGEQAVVPVQDAGQTMHMRTKGRLVALYTHPRNRRLVPVESRGASCVGTSRVPTYDVQRRAVLDSGRELPLSGLVQADLDVRGEAELDLYGAALHELEPLFQKERRGETRQLMGRGVRKAQRDLKVSQRANQIQTAVPEAFEYALAAQRRDVIRYRKVRRGDVQPRMHRFEVGAYVYCAQPPINTLDVKTTRIIILRVAKVYSTGWLDLVGADARVITVHSMLQQQCGRANGGM
eukprot:jgi/Tetstr1/453173/TSEL_040190.t1